MYKCGGARRDSSKKVVGQFGPALIAKDLSLGDAIEIRTRSDTAYVVVRGCGGTGTGSSNANTDTNTNMMNATSGSGLSGFCAPVGVYK